MITVFNTAMNLPKLNPNTPSLMDGEVLLFKSKKPPNIGGLSLIQQRHREEKTLWS
jgi:hypothetical protein